LGMTSRRKERQIWMRLQGSETTRVRAQVSRGISIVYEEAGVLQSEQLYHYRFHGMLLRAGHNGLRNTPHRNRVCARVAMAQEVRLKGCSIVAWPLLLRSLLQAERVYDKENAGRHRLAVNTMTDNPRK
jgi:hypothetical protein